MEPLVGGPKRRDRAWGCLEHWAHAGKTLARTQAAANTTDWRGEDRILFGVDKDEQDVLA